MTDDGTLTWRRLWSETAAVVGERPAARWLCEAASALDAGEFLESLDEPATERMVAHLDSMLARLRDGEPLQYVLGRWGFRRLDLFVDRRVLIPRPETELLVEVALAHLAEREREWEQERERERDRGVDGRSLAGPMRLVDLGTGSGAIGLSLAAELRPGSCEVWLTDISVDALDVARANLAGVGRNGACVRLAHGSWFGALPDELEATLDLVVSNPPYVDDDDLDLEPIVRNWEPAPALFGGVDGLDHVRRIVADASRWLAPRGLLLVEIGASQGERVRGMLEAAGYDDVAVLPDLAGRDRIARARRAG